MTSWPVKILLQCVVSTDTRNFTEYLVSAQHNPWFLQLRTETIGAYWNSKTRISYTTRDKDSLQRGTATGIQGRERHYVMNLFSKVIEEIQFVLSLEGWEEFGGCGERKSAFRQRRANKRAAVGLKNEVGASRRGQSDVSVLVREEWE